jgi:hypothetical protein
MRAVKCDEIVPVSEVPIATLTLHTTRTPVGSRRHDTAGHCARKHELHIDVTQIWILYMTACTLHEMRHEHDTESDTAQLEDTTRIYYSDKLRNSCYMVLDLHNTRHRHDTRTAQDTT